MIEQAEKILILSGEGEQGTFELYTGKRTIVALKARLTKDRCGGDRWALAYIKAGPEYADDTWLELDNSLTHTVDKRTITEDDFE